ncbi:hypothetical protein MLD38_009231 [Melastoma candidum]|uniref:Uncharacterized protein n=1 Tax=Melastoma candidum TaxID=119954 RepID=A0ACB9S0L1_9MYRT|nr:hypothetical protein MLD38_009231 [Melastoma candidum]
MAFGVIGPPAGIRPGGQKQKSVLQTLFDVDSKYTPIKMIRRGSYGLVCSATDIATGGKVAIKKIHAALGNRIEVLMALREMYLLRILKHKNVIDLKHMMMPAEKLTFQDVYLVYELMETDLKQVIQSSQPLSEDHCRYFVYQIVRGLQHIHACNVIHRDLKPGNLFINLDSELKIGDFGLARTAGGDSESMTEYVTTRFYRAPEVLVSNKNYGAAVDIWSVGCIMAEILGRKPLFPGKDSLDQLELIVRTLGSQVQSEMGFISSPLVRRYIESLPYSDGVRFSDLYPEASPMAIDLMERMLVFDPSRRLTARKHFITRTWQDSMILPLMWWPNLQNLSRHSTE